MLNENKSSTHNEEIDKLARYKINLDKIKDLDKLLSNDEKNNYSHFFWKIDIFIENARKIYSQLWTDTKKKEELIVLFLENICFLINNLNIKRVHNRSCGLELEHFNESRQLIEYFRIRWKEILKDNKKWFSCNNINVFIYTLIQNIVWEDNFSSYFLLNEEYNHWRFVLAFKKWLYTFDSSYKWVFLLKDYSDDELYEKIEPLEGYSEKVKEGESKYNMLKYQYWVYILVLEKKWDNIELSYRNSSSDSKDINLLSDEEDNFTYGKLNQILLYKKWYFTNVEKLLLSLKKSVWEHNFKIIKQIISNINQEKLEQFI